jgi:hypothetical protein
MNGLVKLSLQSNLIRGVDFTEFRWYVLIFLSIVCQFVSIVFFLSRKRLEMLNLSQNGLDTMRGFKALSALIALNLGTRIMRCLLVVDPASFICHALPRAG